MLDYGTLQRFVLSLGPEGKVRLQDVQGRVVEVSPGVPDIDGMIEERATHFKIMDRPWMTRAEFMQEFERWEQNQT